MTGPKVLMVNKTSAERIDHLARDIEHLPSHSDHRGLVRFNHSRDDRYISLIENVRGMAERAQNAVDATESAMAQITIPPVPLMMTARFRRDSDFIGRPELALFEKKMLSPGARVALFGLGGIGKSQLAIEYCYRVQAKSQDIAVLWIHASSAARYDQDLLQPALDLGILRSDADRANVPQLVYDWLRNGCNGRWLMVLDNADDATFLVERKSLARSRLEFLPECPQGSIIVTSRSRKVALQVVDDADVVTLEPMGSETAVALLGRKLRDRTDATTLTNLAAALEYIPLALAQAAAYINARWPMCSVEQYLEKLQKSHMSKTSLLNIGLKERLSDEDAVDSVILTWQISFEHIRQVRPTAAHLLSILSFYDHQGIPKRSLFMVVESGNANAPCGEHIDGHSSTSREPNPSLTSHDLETDITALQDYKLISMTILSSLEMHRSLQFAARIWLESNGQYQYWAHRSLANLDRVLPTDEYDYWKQWQLLYPHARSSLEIEVTGREASLRRSSILRKAAWSAWAGGLHPDCERLATMSLHVRERELGKEDQRTISSMEMLGQALVLVGKYAIAEGILRQALEEWEKWRGKECLHTLGTVDNLARALQNQGKYDAAERLYRRALQGREKALGKEHLDTLGSINNLATALQDQREYVRAEKLYRQALDGYERALGRDHPDILPSIDNLASVFRDMGDYQTAETLYQRALEGREKVLGKEHPYTRMSVYNLASLLVDKGEWGRARRLYR